MIAHTPCKQGGAALVIALIMLVLLTLFAVTVMNTSNVNLKITNNLQTRDEAFGAAQMAIERIVSVDFTKSPAAVAAAIPKAVDVNNDGTTDYNVNILTPVCITVMPIKTSQLDIANPADVPCFGSGTASSSGIVKGGKGVGGTGNSLCSNSQWHVQASATDPLTNASATVHQGIAVRVAVGSPC
jgi:Tfp pilus assembly protein PilX